MTLPLNPLRAAELARQAMKQEHAPIGQCEGFDGMSNTRCAYVAGHSGEHLFSRGDASDEIRLKLLHNNRDQRETLLREMAEQLMAAVQEVDETRAQLSGAEAASTATRTHSDARDLAVSMASFIASIDKSSSDVADYIAEQLRPLISRANWHEAASTAGKQKLIEHALSKICCKGEPHTCDQEAIATAEGKTDRLILERDSLRASCEQLTRERDDLRADVRHVQATLQAERLDHISTLGQAAELEAELAKMRPVYEAALAWRVERDRDIIGTAPPGGPRSETGRALIDAIDSALSSTHQAGTK